VTRIDFTTPDVSKRISVKLGDARKYLVKAERELGESKVRDALADARRGLEGILNRLWKKLSNKDYVVQFQVAMRSPDGKPDLKSVADGMRKFLNKHELAQYKDFITLLDEIMKEQKWKLLNKGTHEEDRDEEFDSVLAKALIRDLCKMDDLMTHQPASTSQPIKDTVGYAGSSRFSTAVETSQSNQNQPLDDTQVPDNRPEIIGLNKRIKSLRGKYSAGSVFVYKGCIEIVMKSLSIINSGQGELQIQLWADDGKGYKFGMLDPK